jgi:methyltransferase (TIGR00027 family)
MDFPATQAWKQERLKQAGMAIPEDLAFAPLDFHQQTLAQGLAAAGHDSSRATFFAWLGVTPYLAPEAVAQTLTQVVSCPKGSGLVFDYATSPELLDQRGKMVFDILSGWSRDAGEPWLSTFKPADLGAKLEYLGFEQIDDLGQSEINARYYAGRDDGLGVGTLYHLVSAWV